jgi:hypothetical protein
VSVVQLVEHQVVILGVAGSSPVTHPTGQREAPDFFLLWGPCDWRATKASGPPRCVGNLQAEAGF